MYNIKKTFKHRVTTISHIAYHSLILSYNIAPAGFCLHLHYGPLESYNFANIHKPQPYQAVIHHPRSQHCNQQSLVPVNIKYVIHLHMYNTLNINNMYNTLNINKLIIYTVKDNHNGTMVVVYGV